MTGRTEEEVLEAENTRLRLARENLKIKLHACFREQHQLNIAIRMIDIYEEQQMKLSSDQAPALEPEAPEEPPPTILLMEVDGQLGSVRQVPVRQLPPGEDISGLIPVQVYQYPRGHIWHLQNQEKCGGTSDHSDNPPLLTPSTDRHSLHHYCPDEINPFHPL